MFPTKEEAELRKRKEQECFKRTLGEQNEPFKNLFEKLKELTLAKAIGTEKAKDFSYNSLIVTTEQHVVFDSNFNRSGKSAKYFSTVRVSYVSRVSSCEEISVIFDIVAAIYKVRTYTMSGSSFFNKEIGDIIKEILDHYKSFTEKE